LLKKKTKKKEKKGMEAPRARAGTGAAWSLGATARRIGFMFSTDATTKKF
jgi:hypothetical protein